jgi:hypothetical protein
MVSTVGAGPSLAEMGPTLFTEHIIGWNSIKIKRDNQVFRKIKGIRGTATRSRTFDRSFSIEVSIDQNSKSNLVLSSLLRLDGNGVLERPLKIMLKDGVTDNTTISDYGNFKTLTGSEFPAKAGTTMESFTCYISGFPEVEFTDEAIERVWTFECIDASEYIVGRGASLRQALLDAASPLINGLVSEVKSVVSSSLPSITKIFNT